jgi:cytochrome P450
MCAPTNSPWRTCGETIQGVKAGRIPGPRGPSVLNLVRYGRDPLGFLPRMRARYGDVFAIPFPTFGRAVYTAAPGPVKELFTGSPAVMHAGEANATILEPAVGPFSVLTLDDDEHMRQRKLLLAPFHGRAIEHYRDVMLAAIRRDMETWPVGRPFPLRPRMQGVTLDVILRAVYGLSDLESARDVIDEFAVASDSLLVPSWLRRGWFPPWRRFLRARAALDALVYQTIADRRADPEAGSKDDVLSLLMRATDEDGTPLTDAELRDELVTVVGAGHETTATALSWTIERLVRHPDALERLRSSLAAGETEYLDATIKEALRARPVIADVARRAKAPVSVGGYEVPEGSLVLAAITALHYREDLYPDPQRFRPERFLEAEGADTYTWIPFGGGVRRCLGAAFAQEEMRVMLREIVTRCELAPTSAADERIVMRNITLAPAGGAVVTVTAKHEHADVVGLVGVAQGVDEV